MLSENYTILIVDDNMNNIQLLASMLTSNGFNVEFATNGFDAIQWIKEETFDLVLLDIMMPEMDGYDVCETIRKDKKHKDLPVIFLTAKTDKESIVKGFTKGGNDYVTKPFDMRELLARVNTQIELKNSREKLAQINTWLEEQVADRTAELNKALDEVNDLNKKLLQLDEVKSEFLKMISHEIRTPLNGIIGFTDIIKNTNEAESLMEYIDLLEQSALRLEKFSLNALLLTSLKLGNYYVDLTGIHMKPVLESCISKFQEQSEQKPVTIKTECPDTLKAALDSELFPNVIDIIIDNAIRYSPSGGIIKVKSEVVDDKVEICINDQGPGFNSKTMKNLFEFFGAGEHHFDQNLGLGLALANQIILAHNGKIKISNLQSGGASVKVILPSAQKTACNPGKL